MDSFNKTNLQNIKDIFEKKQVFTWMARSLSLLLKWQ